MNEQKNGIQYISMCSDHTFVNILNFEKLKMLQ